MPSESPTAILRSHLELRLRPLTRNAVDVDTQSTEFKELTTAIERSVRLLPSLQDGEIKIAALGALARVRIPSQHPPNAFEVDHVRLLSDQQPAESHSQCQRQIQIHAYFLRTRSVHLQTASITYVPCAQLEHSWESLCMLPRIKRTLLSYVWVRLQLGSSAACNGLILLCGPPGTGKTTIAKALAHKSAVRFGVEAALMHVHADKLLSKWFAESARNVAELINHVVTVSQTTKMVFVLLDEVESLGLARSSSIGGADPGDAIRVVNALLQGIDMLSEYKNVILLATSNLASKLDNALLDRADLTLRLDVPEGEMRATVVFAAIDELVQLGLVEAPSLQLRVTAKQSVHRALEQHVQMSGRRLRKLAVVALAEAHESGEGVVPFEPFIKALLTSIARAGE